MHGPQGVKHREDVASPLLGREHLRYQMTLGRGATNCAQHCVCVSDGLSGGTVSLDLLGILSANRWRVASADMRSAQEVVVELANSCERSAVFLLRWAARLDRGAQGTVF